MEFTKKELEKEIWKDIPGYEGLYQVSNLGRVKSLAREWIAGSGTILKHDDIILKYKIDKKGEGNPSSKLTEEQVRKIRYTAKYEKVEWGYWLKLAKELNISDGVISNIIHNRIWKHIIV